MGYPTHEFGREGRVSRDICRGSIAESSEICGLLWPYIGSVSPSSSLCILRPILSRVKSNAFCSRLTVEDGGVRCNAAFAVELFVPRASHAEKGSPGNNGFSNSRLHSFFTSPSSPQWNKLTMGQQQSEEQGARSVSIGRFDL